MQVKSKKGQMGAITALAYGIITFAVVIIVGMAILTNFAYSQGSCDADTSDVEEIIDEAGWVNQTGYQLDAGLVAGFLLTGNETWNTTAPLLIPVANYSISSTGLVRNTTIAEYHQDITFNYNYTINEPRTLNKATMECRNATLGNPVDPTGSAYVDLIYLNTQLNSSGLAGWTPAIIAITIGMIFLGMFMLRGRKR